MLRTDYFNEVTVFLKDSKGHKFPLSMLLGIIAVLDSKWIHYLWEQLLPVLMLDGLMNFLSALFKFLLISLFAFSTIAYVIIDSSEKMRKNQPSLSLAISTSLLLSLIFNYTLQYGIKADAELLGYYVFPGATLYQFSVLTLFSLFIYLLINRYISTTLILIVLGTILSVVNILKFNMRS
ncbi:hypothetical protein ACUJ42_03415 [Streptococcus anginosus]|uniref:hypothetical protein n=1 Tax=Streptococcus anginosus TaxID=1328 RepID=UPI000E99A28B|nr:hypothetical protein [Streptococcus anginosus]HBJ54302.1 hypothetical protein [Streptococcus sp.]